MITNIPNKSLKGKVAVKTTSLWGRHKEGTVLTLHKSLVKKLQSKGFVDVMDGAPVRKPVEMVTEKVKQAKKAVAPKAKTITRKKK